MFPTDRRLWLAAGALIFALPSLAAPALAEPMRSRASFDTADQTPAAEQPADGTAVVYTAALDGGTLDACRLDVAEQLFPRDEGAWGIFQVATAVACPNGGFRYTSTGAWDATGFHGAGRVEPGSGTGAFEGGDQLVTVARRVESFQANEAALEQGGGGGRDAFPVSE